MGRGEMGENGYTPSYLPRTPSTAPTRSSAYDPPAYTPEPSATEAPPAYSLEESFQAMSMRVPIPPEEVPVTSSGGLTREEQYCKAFEATSPEKFMDYLMGIPGAFSDKGTLPALLPYIDLAKRAFCKYIREWMLAAQSARDHVGPPDQKEVQDWFARTCRGHMRQQRTPEEQHSIQAAFVHVGRAGRSFNYYMEGTFGVTRLEMNSEEANRQLVAGYNAYTEVFPPKVDTFHQRLIMVYIGAAANFMYNQKMLEEGYLFEDERQIGKYTSVLGASAENELDAVEVMLISRLSVYVRASTLTPEQYAQEQRALNRLRVAAASASTSELEARKVAADLHGKLVADRDSFRTTHTNSRVARSERRSPPRTGPYGSSA